MEQTPHLSSAPEKRRTILAVERLRQEGFFEEPDGDSRNGYFEGRSIIGRDTPINGGVYLGSGKREAIVVDDQKDRRLQEATETLAARLVERTRGTDLTRNQVALRTVFDLVRELIPYSDPIADQVMEELHVSDPGPDPKVALGVYIGRHGGVCRHQALLGAYLLERMAKAGVVGGHVSIDRGNVPGMGGHAWIRYVNSGGDVFIIDPAQKYIGARKDVPAYKEFYLRETD